MLTGTPSVASSAVDARCASSSSEGTTLITALASNTSTPVAIPAPSNYSPTV